MDPQAPQQAGQYNQYNAGQPALDPTVGPMLAPQNPAAPNPPRPGVASVLNYGKGVVRVRWPDGRLTGGNRPLRRPVMIQDVDLGRHYSTFTADVPAAGGGVLRFAAEIDIEWQAADPLQVVHTNTNNVVAALRHRLLNQISPICARYAIETPVEAEDAIRAWCQSGAASRLGEDCGLEIQVYVRLRTNAQAEAIQQEIQKTVGAGQVGAASEGEMLRKVQIYSGLLQGGQSSQAAMMIAQDPTNMPNILSALWEQGAASRQETIGFVKTLIASGAIQPHQISGQARAALAYLESSTARVIDPSPHIEPVPAPQLVNDRYDRRSLETGRGERSDAAARPAMRDRWRQRPEPAPSARPRYDDEVRQPRRRSAEPTYEEPTYEEPAYEEPTQTYDEPTPKYEEPTYDEPTYEEPTYNEPAYDEPAVEERPLPRRRPMRERPAVREAPEAPRRRPDRESAWQEDEPEDEEREPRTRATGRPAAGSSSAPQSSANWQSSGYFDLNDVD